MGAGVMLLCGNKTLIMRRAHYKHDKWSGCWNFPGGQGEMGESAYETALRETEEETGITPEQYQVVDHVDDKIYMMFVGVCKEELVPTLDHEHTEWEWIVISKIPRLKDEMHPKDWRGFKKYYRL
jgi:mutator protein MutT